ncbi:MAG: hypothetical protein NC924_06160 [Candidatus Omnitrophica bacterium]|nr:hypothetical protein [Candidatus Omnitrophota bacterium]
MNCNVLMWLGVALILLSAVFAEAGEFPVVGQSLLAPKITVVDEAIPSAFAQLPGKKAFLAGKEGDVPALLSLAARLSDPAMRLARQIIANSSRTGLEGQIKKDSVLFEKLAEAVMQAVALGQMTMPNRIDPILAGDIFVVNHKNDVLIYIATGETTLDKKPIFITNIQEIAAVSTYGLTRATAEVSIAVVNQSIAKRYRLVDDGGVRLRHRFEAGSAARIVTNGQTDEQAIVRVAKILVDAGFPHPENLVRLRKTQQGALIIQIDLSLLTSAQRRSATDFTLEQRHIEDLLAVQRVARIIVPQAWEYLKNSYSARVVVAGVAVISPSANINETMSLASQAI